MIHWSEYVPSLNQIYKLEVWCQLRSFLRTAWRILRLTSSRTSAHALRKWRFFLFGLAHARGKSSFCCKRVRWPINFSLFLIIVKSLLSIQWIQTNLYCWKVRNQRKRELHLSGLETTACLEQVESLSCLCTETYLQLIVPWDRGSSIVKWHVFRPPYFSCSCETWTEWFNWYFSGSW